MKNGLLLLLLLCIGLPVSAQFGITARYHANNSNRDINLVDDDLSIENTVLGDGFSVGIDYWFRLKNYRVEFLPEINYSSFQQDLAANGVSLSTDAINFYFNTHLYLFDLQGDCDCPTFSKQGPTLQKGFFLQLSPGVSSLSNRIANNGAEVDIQQFVYSMGIGVGFDLGISDLVTVTPQVGVRFFPASNWTNSPEPPRSTTPVFTKAPEESVTQFFAGIRLGIRLDE